MIQSCLNCSQNFEVLPEDLLFYEKISTVINGKKFLLPAPTQCPSCRQQRRIALRNERFLHKRNCDLCGKNIVSVFSQDAAYVVYCNECFYSDKWDPLSYGRDYDFSRPFFEQFNELEKSIPHFALFQDNTSENCEYVNHGSFNKNCYLMLGAWCEEVYYSNSTLKLKSSMDCLKCIGGELLYECVDCTGCYNLAFSQDCNECTDSYFLKDCRNSKDCFCSVGLRNARFVFQNQQLSEDEYKQKMKEVQFNNEHIRYWENLRDEISLTIPKKYIHGLNNEDVTGDYLDNCKNLKECFDCMGIQDSAYCYLSAMQTHHNYDSCYAGIGTELCYEINGAETFNRCKFVYYGNNLYDVEYSKYCQSSNNLFGCIGLRHKQYFILNKQYSKDEYEQLMAKIIAQMTEQGEYGEYFAIKDSLFPYNETVAYEYFPLTREVALEKGYRWRDSLPAQSVQNGLSCLDCGRLYKIIAQEAKLYEHWQFPVPEKCPECRHKIRFAKRNPRLLWQRSCHKCCSPIQTTYAPDRHEIVYCENCYLQERY